MPRGKATAMLARRRHKELVLDVIRTCCPISRTEIARLTGINNATVSGIVGDLIQAGVLHHA
jgi:DNA-binding IclR family transcriptional regulator